MPHNDSLLYLKPVLSSEINFFLKACENMINDLISELSPVRYVRVMHILKADTKNVFG